jgi:hypothetical protein
MAGVRSLMVQDLHKTILVSGFGETQVRKTVPGRDPWSIEDAIFVWMRDDLGNFAQRRNRLSTIVSLASESQTPLRTFPFAARDGRMTSLNMHD